MLKIIYVNFDNIKKEFDKFVGQTLGNHVDDNDSNIIKYYKFINFFVNNRSTHFK